jgi:nucleotide-binding universal stress UspA family protein
MKRYLVVANQTLGGLALVTAIRQRLAEGPHSFYVVVPATPSAFLRWELHAQAAGGDLVPDARGRRYAHRRLDAELSRLRSIGAEADGEVGDVHPLQAIRDVLAREQFDEIIISTLPQGVSRWLRMDLPDRVARRFNLPVTHIVGPAGDEDMLMEQVVHAFTDPASEAVPVVKSTERRGLNELIVLTENDERYRLTIEALDSQT